MPSSIEFKTPYDFAGLRGWYNAERWDRNGQSDGASVANVINIVERGPDFADRTTVTYQQNIINTTLPVFRISGIGARLVEEYGSGVRQEDVTGLHGNLLDFLYQGPLTGMFVMRQTSTFGAERGYWGYGSDVSGQHGFGLFTTTTPEWEFRYIDTSGTARTTTIPGTPTTNEWEIMMFSYDAVDGSFRVGITDFYEDATVIDLSTNNFRPTFGAYPYAAWLIGKAWGSDISAGEVAMWAFWSGISPNEKAWDGLLRYAGTKYGITLS